MNKVYILSLTRREAVIYSGSSHHMAVRSAARRFADDAMVVAYSGQGHLARDILKLRSAGECHLSTTERELIAQAV